MAPNDRSFNTPVQHCVSPEQNVQPNVWQVPAEYEWNGASISPRVMEDSYHRDVESGLYWLWDMTWNGVGG